jgi:hypothetical protein
MKLIKGVYKVNLIYNYKHSERLWGPRILLPKGYQGSFPGVKQPRYEANCSPPFSAEVRE